MRASEISSFAISMLAPPSCVACHAPCDRREPLCAGCAASLARCRGGEAAIGAGVRAVWAASFDGIARDLIASFKFGARPAIARPLAARLARELDPVADTGVLVPVPAAPLRSRARGFDPAGSLATALGRELGRPVVAALRRANGPRQVGRARVERLRAPPHVRASARVPAVAIVVDDVLTTGATALACAAALRTAGAVEVGAAVFARTLGPGQLDA